MYTVRRIPCGNVNVHLVESETGGILVDTGKREHVSQVLAACKDAPVRLLVLTHAHFDHAENAARLSDALGIPIAMSGDDCDLIASNSRQPLSASTVPGKIVLAASLREFSVRTMPQFTPDILLRDGDSLSAYGIDAKIIALPGHTRGSVGVDVEGRDIFVGDALMNMFYPTVSMLYNDRDQMLASARKISRLGERTVWFGHGKPRPNRQWVK